MKRQNRQFTKFISLLKFPGLQYIDFAFVWKTKNTSKQLLGLTFTFNIVTDIYGYYSANFAVWKKSQR